MNELLHIIEVDTLRVQKNYLLITVIDINY